MRGHTRTGWQVIGAAAIAMTLASAGALGESYCCICKGKTTGKTINAADELTAGAQCSISCMRPTMARPGACEAASAPAPATPATTPAPSAATGTVLLFASDDCSGDGTKVSGSAARVVAGMRSVLIESGGPASVWQKADYSGAQLQPVGPGTCISPGWEIGSVKFQGN